MKAILSTKKLIVPILLVVSTSAYTKSLSLSVSTNGNYAISSDDNSHAYLYDLNKHTVKDLGDNYNPRSAYFVPNSNNYLLQNKDTNEVTIDNIDGETVYKFNPKIQANSNAISSDLKYYVTSDSRFNIYLYTPHKTVRRQILKSSCMGDKETEYKGLKECSYGHADFSFKNNDRLLFTTSGYLYDYDIPKNEWNARPTVGGPNAINSIDPSGEFVYTADSSRVGTAYNLNTQKLLSEKNGIYFTDKVDDVTYLKNNEKKSIMQGISNFKFIDKDKIIVTFKGTNQPYLWAWFFTPSKFDWSGNGKYKRPMFYSDKYAKLVDNPLDYITGNYTIGERPNTSSYNTAFDTSVEAHKLVMAQANGNGIMVYNYNPKDESLKLDWVGVPAKATESKEEKKGWFW
jgi:hypothetical protein